MKKETVKNEPFELPPFVGISENVSRIRELISHVADSGLNVVISGESGVGKEVVARNLYYHSPRQKHPFIKVNCAALPEGLLESELFGHEQGAFTGAERKKRGKFELAHKGVLMLDEIGDMPMALQAKLLHVLQSGEFSPLGSEKDIKTDVWIVAATNHDLKRDIADQQFREDLYYRLNIINIHIDPLRERPADIPVLIDFFMSQYADRFGKRNASIISDQVLNCFTTYQWPGNVRELQNVLKRMMVLGDSEQVINELSVTLEKNENPPQPEPHPPARSAESFAAPDPTIFLPQQPTLPLDGKTFSLKEIRKKTLDRVEKEVITYVLEKTGWNRSKANKILGISYKTLLYKINDLDISPSDQ